MTRETASKIAAALGLLALVLALAPAAGAGPVDASESAGASRAPVASGTVERSLSSSPGADSAPQVLSPGPAFAQWLLPPLGPSDPRDADVLLPSPPGLQIVRVTVLLR